MENIRDFKTLAEQLSIPEAMQLVSALRDTHRLVGVMLSPDDIREEFCELGEYGEEPTDDEVDSVLYSHWWREDIPEAVSDAAWEQLGMAVSEVISRRAAVSGKVS